MPSGTVLIHLINNSTQDLRLAVFQEDARPLVPPCSSCFWEVRTLGKGAQLPLQWPHLDLQVAGLIGVAGSGETTSTSNIEDAKDGQRWVLTQEPGEALRIAPASELASGCDINLWPRPFLCVAVVPKRVEREGRVDRSQMSRHEPWALSLGAPNPSRATAPSSARTPPPAGSASPFHRSLVSSSPGAVFRLTLLRQGSEGGTGRPCRMSEKRRWLEWWQVGRGNQVAFTRAIESRAVMKLS